MRGGEGGVHMGGGGGGRGRVTPQIGREIVWQWSCQNEDVCSEGGRGWVGVLVVTCL